MVWLSNGKKVWRYVYSLWYNTRTRQTPSRTDRHHTSAQAAFINSVVRQKLHFIHHLTAILKLTKNHKKTILLNSTLFQAVWRWVLSLFCDFWSFRCVISPLSGINCLHLSLVISDLQWVQDHLLTFTSC